MQIRKVKRNLTHNTMALAEAIRLLRSKLGESQEGMARRLGCSTSGYIKWEHGAAIPRGDVAIKMIWLCPDEESRSAFASAVDFFAKQSDGSVILGEVKSISADTETDAQLREYARVIEKLFRDARSGDQNARQLLRDTRDRLFTAIASRDQTRTANQTLREPIRLTGERASSGKAGKRRAKKKRPARVRARAGKRAGG
jgi:transcriptional regulator with XRE-family HTH domain